MIERLSRALFRSIRGRLLLLSAAVILPAVLVSGLLVAEAHRSERAAVARQLSETARALSLVVDRQLGQSEALLQALATSPSLEQEDWRTFHRQAEAALAAHGGSWIVLLQPDGRQLVNTAVPFGTPLPSVEVPADIAAELRRGGTYVSNLLPSAIRPGEKVYSVALPLRRDGKIHHVLALVAQPSRLNALLTEQRVPPEWIAAIIDRSGTITARSRRADEFVGGPATPDIRAIIAQQPAGLVESTTLDGMKTLAAFQRTPGAGWTVIIGAPQHVLFATAQRLLLIILILVALPLGIGIVMSAWVARGVARSVEDLAERARGVGRGRLPPSGDTGMQETDQVADALRDAAERLRSREQELLALNETLEARVEEATATLVQAQKLEALGRLTGGIAHDFNNLLAAVRVSLDLLARSVRGEMLVRCVNAARQATERGAKLTTQLLAFARRQRLEPQPVDVNAVVQGMSELLGSTLGGAVQVQPVLAPDLPLALADRTQLELIIMNLAINARDALPDGGTIRIETACERVTEPSPAPEAPGPGEYVVVAVVDAGTGMTPEVRARVLEPFFTTKGAGGSGLGLPQVLGVVKQLGGGMTIDSEPGRGTQVRIFLPRSAAALEPRQAAEAATDRARIEGLRVLVVDDDADVREGIARLLQDMGCVALQAESGPRALAMIDEAEVDAVLADYAMPAMTGAELAAELSRRRPQLPVVLMSGYIAEQPLEQNWQGPMLRKPFSEQALARSLHEAAEPPAGDAG